MLNVAIVEDSEKDMANLRECIEKYGKETGIPVNIAEFKNAVLFLQNYKPVYDVIFLDIMMPAMSGMDAAEKLRKFDEEVALIFVTDMAQFALKGYEVNALDYMLKPCKYYNIKLRLDKIYYKKDSRLPSVIIHIPGYGDKVVQSQDIYYIEIFNKDLTYHTVSGNYSSRSVGLKKIEEQLASSGFARCSSSYLVNLAQCTELRDNEVVVGGDVLKISRNFKQDFITKLSEVFTKHNYFKRG